MADWSPFLADRAEYSRHEEARNTINVTLTPDSYTPLINEGCRVSLVRDDGYGVVGTGTTTFAGGETTVSASITLESCVDSGGFYCAKAGKYHLEVDRLDTNGDLVADTTEQGPTIYVSLITVAQLKTKWLYGIPLIAGAVLAVRRQPTNITGVEVSYVPQDHPRGTFTLAFVSGPPQTLAWGDGATAVQIVDGLNVLPLGDVAGRTFIEVEVVTSQLPATNQSDVLAIDHDRLSDEILRDHIQEATAWFVLKTYIIPEPTAYASPLLADRDTYGWFDEVGPALAYIRPTNFNQWLAINMPYHHLLAVYNLDGYLNDSRNIEIPEGWITFTSKSSLIELVPRMGAVTSWNFYGTAFTLWNARPHIPSFWQWRALYGLRDLFSERAVVLSKIGDKAAMEIAIKAGEAMTGGRQSYSVGRDGITESRSYSPGVWQKRIEQWEKSLDPKEMRKVKRRIVGIQMVVLS